MGLKDLLNKILDTEIPFTKDIHITTENRKKSDQEHMGSAGLKLYVWETCGDEHVCAACRIMDGKLCRWDDPTVYSSNKGKTWKPRPKTATIVHPGENTCKNEGHCRCTSIAYWDELVGEA